MKKKLMELKKKVLLLSLSGGSVITGLTGCDFIGQSNITYVYEVYEKQIDEKNNEEWVLINKELELNKDISDGRKEYPSTAEEGVHKSDNLKFILVNEYMDCTNNKKNKIGQK